MRPPRARIPPARRRRTVTEEEASLWRRFVTAAGIAPLQPEPRPRDPREWEGANEPDAAAASALPQVRERGRARTAPPPPPDLAIGVAPGGLDRRRWDDLRRGRMLPERTLDLHGRRAEDAHDAVRRFVRAAQADGLRCIAIVTGKGTGETGGVLRRELPHWLNAPPLRDAILAIAHPHRANTGAVHLLLRRKRT
ncbi:Smr/MutS family protein [Elioraea sp.]|uniref:Smr/MutS family protein n=1 Tax=Elioraea sp. TaxID=2185103 RepID=UPI003F72A235